MSGRQFHSEHKELKFALTALRKKGNAMNNSHIKASSDYAFNYTEHLVAKKADSKIILQRLAIIIIGLILLAALLFVTFGPVLKVPQIGAVALLLIAYVCKVLWGYTKIEYEYLIVSGEMTMDIIYAGKKRRKIAEFKVPTAEAILPLADAKLEGVKTTFASGSPDDEDAYCAIYKNESGDREALVFNADERALKMLHYYNKATVIKK